MTPEAVLFSITIVLFGVVMGLLWSAFDLKKSADRSLVESEALHAAIRREITAAHRDAAEAFMLWNHGAHDEAIELLNKRGARVHMTSIGTMRK